MPGVCRLGDTSTGACKCCPITNTGANSNVLINGLPPAKVGDLWGYHKCDCSHSKENCVIGNSSVLVNGSPIVTVGTKLSNGDSTGSGSSDVMVG